MIELIGGRIRLPSASMHSVLRAVAARAATFRIAPGDSGRTPLLIRVRGSTFQKTSKRKYPRLAGFLVLAPPKRGRTSDLPLGRRCCLKVKLGKSIAYVTALAPPSAFVLVPMANSA